MSFADDPIINSPFREPEWQYQLDAEGQPTGLKLKGRRGSVQVVPVASTRRRTKQGELELADGATQVKPNQLVNDIRARVALWRKVPPGKRGVRPETARLLDHWSRADRRRKLFFCQLEALETLIYLTEVDTERFRAPIMEANAEANPGLLRLATKMATGSGKTTVMAMIIAWHAVNRARQRGAGKFTDAFLVVCPGITIRDRLRNLLPSDPENIYEALDLVPPDMLDAVRRARIVITNYHGFMPRETEDVSKLNREILGGRDGRKSFIETEGQMIARVAKTLGGRRDIVVLNDEAHHCYRENVRAVAERAAKVDGEDKEEAKRNNDAARVWISGLEAFQRERGVGAVYDVSATPFFLRGSGYEEGALFPWVVSDFGLLEAIESGITKVPRLPTLDDRVAGEMPLFRNLYARVKGNLPKKGRGKQAGPLDPQETPALLQSALEALYDHYARVFAQWAERPDLARPPVMIVVCNNTATSKLMFDLIAGYEIASPEGSVRPIEGRHELFRNTPGQPMRTLLVDSEELDSGDALSDEFLAAAAPEIAAFKAELRRRGGAEADKLAPAQILREVMNTVGRPGKLGEGIRCVVSVSMLTEGWDANTVTHILGVRAFGTQLLCEQVVGRGLRRVSYEVDPETGLFPVEYADVLGIPFTFAQTAKSAAPKPPPRITRVHAMPERADLVIRYPRVEGYRVVFPRRPLRAEFTADSGFEITTDMIPTLTTNEPFIGEATTLDLRINADALRLRSVVFDVAGLTLREYFKDEAGAVEVWRYPELVRITQQWFDDYLVCRGACRKQFLKWKPYAEIAAQKIKNACARSLAAERDGADRPLPILDAFNPEGSTAHVDFTTSKQLIFGTTHSHLSHVVGDSEWELAFAERLEQMGAPVLAYVKNQGLGFEIPYSWDNEEHRYRPDYIVRLDDGGSEPLNLVVEIRGLKDNQDSAKADAATALWVPAVNNAGRFGRWAYLEIAQNIYEAEAAIRAAAGRA